MGNSGFFKSLLDTVQTEHPSGFRGFLFQLLILFVSLTIGLILIGLVVFSIGCASTETKAFQYAVESNPSCDIHEIERGDGRVVVDVWCGCDYPDRRVYRRASR